MKVLEEWGGEQGREEGSSLLELASVHSTTKVGHWSRSLLREMGRGCTTAPEPALKFRKKLVSLLHGLAPERGTTQGPDQLLPPCPGNGSNSGLSVMVESSSQLERATLGCHFPGVDSPRAAERLPAPAEEPACHIT